jgi:pilus assembly protein CpaC
MTRRNTRQRARQTLFAALLSTFASASLTSFDTSAQELPAWVDETNEIDLEVGATHTVSAVGVRSFSEGVRGVADIKLTTDSKQFVISGKSPGTTQLLLIDSAGKQSTYTINVFPKSPAVVRAELEQLLEGTPGIRVRRVGPRFFIEGGVGTDQEAARIEKIASLYPEQVESLVTVGAGAAERGINLRVDFYFVQYRQTNEWGAGLDWPSTFGAGATVTGNWDSLTNQFSAAGVVSQVLPKLDLAAASGTAKILRHSTVITSNGNAANFDSGGEENFRTGGELNASITSISYGANVTVLPRLDPVTGHIDLSVKAEMADLGAPGTGTDLPSRTTSELDTAVRIELGQAFVLSGIRVKGQRTGRRGIPLLSDIPILGMLFGKHQAAEEEMEGAIFVVPTTVESVPKPARELIESALEQYEEFDGDVADVKAFSHFPAESGSTATSSSPAAKAKH